MACIDDIPLNQRHSLLRWAVVEHYCRWDTFDGALVKQFKNDKELDAGTLRYIAKEYLVNRNIRKDPSSSGSKPQTRDHHAEWLARELGNLKKCWPENLAERATQCADLARRAAKKHTKGELASGITKVMWFLKPLGWTMFDSFSATALNCNGKRATDRMLNFFTELGDRNFDQWNEAIDCTLAEFGLNYLYGGRVIDKFLWLCGSPVVTCNARIKDLQRELDGLSRSERACISNAARTIANVHAADLLGRDREIA